MLQSPQTNMMNMNPMALLRVGLMMGQNGNTPDTLRALESMMGGGAQEPLLRLTPTRSRPSLFPLMDGSLDGAPGEASPGSAVVSDADHSGTSPGEPKPAGATAAGAAADGATTADATAAGAAAAGATAAGATGDDGQSKALSMIEAMEAEHRKALAAADALDPPTKKPKAMKAAVNTLPMKTAMKAAPPAKKTITKPKASPAMKKAHPKPKAPPAMKKATAAPAKKDRCFCSYRLNFEPNLYVFILLCVSIVSNV